MALTPKQQNAVEVFNELADKPTLAVCLIKVFGHIIKSKGVFSEQEKEEILILQTFVEGMRSES